MSDLFHDEQGRSLDPQTLQVKVKRGGVRCGGGGGKKILRFFLFFFQVWWTVFSSKCFK